MPKKRKRTPRLVSSQFIGVRLLLRELASVVVVWHMKAANFVEFIPRLSNNLKTKNVRAQYFSVQTSYFHPLISSICFIKMKSKDW